MSRNKLPPLAELRKQLKSRPAPAPRPGDAPLDDVSLFRSSVKDARALPASDRAEIKQAPPPSVPRRKDTTESQTEASAPMQQDAWVPAHWLESHSSNSVTASSEDQLLANALQGVVPMRSDKVFLEAPKPRPVPIQHQLDEQAALSESIYAPTPLELVLEGGDELYYLKEGIPRTTLRDLRRGRWVVQAQIDLHGLNRDEARDRLAAAFADWRKRDIRCVRIIHGKGLGSPGKEPVLKKLVAGWLMNYDDVLGYCQARVHDGGAGALLVLMRANKR
ncbi:Smr/MutS family protein [Uliginosibacterium sp. H3]|uniref:Smr/MutS family protein n=1 Tax=Uliginosibacterium silvisoli TaxID=3114758 RepID=A0ABU6K7B4_9RHOO|nr:Smr/MutS family protein [Uliginosibacterium sp. H3]